MYPEVSSCSDDFGGRSVFKIIESTSRPTGGITSLYALHLHEVDRVAHTDGKPECVSQYYCNAAINDFRVYDNRMGKILWTMLVKNHALTLR
jgi:hypothetical protein